MFNPCQSSLSELLISSVMFTLVRVSLYDRFELKMEGQIPKMSPLASKFVDLEPKLSRAQFFVLLQT